MNLAYSIFVAVVWFLSTYFMIVFMLLLLTKKKSLFTSPEHSIGELPIVSIIVPAYNEEKTIADSIASLRKVDYPVDKLDIIIINDGSKDRTSEAVRFCLKTDDPIRFIDNKVNKGKAACLNQGIQLSKGEFVATMDSDSEVAEDVFRKTIPYFKNRKVGAVTVSVEVKNPRNLLEKMVDIEYIVGLSLSLKALSFLNAVHVTPGPFSIYRKSMLDKIGYFDTENITEDLEIAYRIQKGGYVIENCTTTKVRTVIPSTMKGLYVQRKRWYTGGLMTLSKHRDIIFNSSYGMFGITVPYTFLLTMLGLGLFGYSIFLVIKNIVKSLSFYSLTDFNFFSHLFPLDIDPLMMSSLTFFGTISVMFTIVGAIACLKISGKAMREKMVGIMGFTFMFFFYQVFWASSIYNVLLGRKVRWR